MTEVNQNPWGGRRRRDSKFAIKREAVLDRAAAMFADKGYGSLSLNELAESLEITKPTLYYYFASKDDLILEIKRRALDTVIAGLEDAERLQGSGRQKFEKFVRHYIDVAVSDYSRCLITVNVRDLSPSSRKKIQVRARDVESRVQALMIEGMEDGSLSQKDLRISYQSIFGMLNSLAVWFKERGPVKHEQMAQEVLSIVFDGLGAVETR